SCFFPPRATPQISTLSLHDALPISWRSDRRWGLHPRGNPWPGPHLPLPGGLVKRSRTLLLLLSALLSLSGVLVVGFLLRAAPRRSEEHTSELQSQSNLVCRLLLEKK